MWIENVDWASHQSDYLLVIMFAIPVVCFAILGFKKYRDNKRNKQRVQNHDWISKLEAQLQLFEHHNRIIEEKGIEIDYTLEEVDEMQSA